ncbi:hypothetical protein GXP67_26925 [Rhodocytophaga rosea]|uniref:Uncharacterized protein n=1 Tax=Rhodocytophaga rosea TaxID=2704465 RepID=A0A6C0GPN9_9BACT|nr:hypothetical protein [Rhodocytophaga rosea]QHT70019.1 hypothetical protein GXP67_26925 [Rhodocytophaga rosea]
MITKYVFFLSLLICCNGNQQSDKRIQIKEPVCDTGTMKNFYYEFSPLTDIPAIKNLENDFVIVTGTSLTGTDFISKEENQYRRSLKEYQTVEDELKSIEAYRVQEDTLYEHDSIFLTLSREEQIKQLQVWRDGCKYIVDSIHQANNNGLQIVWLINNSSDTVRIATTDSHLLIIIEAIDIKGKWRPVEFHYLDHHGFVYRRLPPKKATAFISTSSINGNFNTKLRYKLLGFKKYYYSNEFDGSIDYCQFEKNPKYSHAFFTRHYMMFDSIIGYEPQEYFDFISIE